MANTNPGGLDLNVSPYFDDYDEDKKFTRVLYRPGRAVQARELTQAQTYQQAQIRRFADYFFKQGSIIDGCEVKLDTNLDFVKIQTNYNGSEVDVEDFKGKIIYGANSGLKAYCGIVSDLENEDPKTLFINYLSTGSVVLTTNVAPITLVSGNTITFSTGNTATIEAGFIDPISGTCKILVSNVTGILTTTTANTVSNTGSIISISVSDVNDRRSNTVFLNSDTLFTKDVTSRAYALAATSRATINVVDEGLSTQKIYLKGSKVTIKEGVMWTSDHFVKNSEQTIILDKYKNVPSYKVGLVPVKTFVDHIADTSLLDNSQGTPNFQAPGADRLKIDVSLAKVALGQATDENEFITMVEIEDGSIREKKSTSVERKLESEIAKRTFEESGDYTLNDPLIYIREHLLINDNNGKYSSNNGGQNDFLLAEIDPFVSYVSGYRNETFLKNSVPILKGLDTEYREQTKTQINYGQYIEVRELVGAWDFMEGTKVDLYDTAQQVITKDYWSAASLSGSKIGEARVRAIEHVSGVHGVASATYYLYLYEMTMNANKNFADVRSIYDSATPSRFADVVLSPAGNAVLNESSFNTLIFKLPYDAIKTIRDDQQNIESQFRFKKKFSITFNSGIATISSTDSSETFVGTGELSDTQKNEFYMAVVTNGGANVETTSLSGTVTVSASSNAVTGTSTSFTTQVNIGDVLKINSLNRKVSSISNNTFLNLEDVHTTGATSNTFTKILPAGAIIPLTNFGGTGSERSVNIPSPGTAVVDIKENATFTADVITTMDRINAREKKKTLVYQATANINPDVHSNGKTGPFSLGYGDVYQIHAIYQSSNFSTAATTSNTDVTSNYKFDNGQRDYAYEHATITPNPGVTPTGRLLVVFDHFTHDTTQGVGYFSVDSYPVNDSAASNTTITTATISQFRSPISGTLYKLRDCVDFRPIKTANTSLNPIDTGTYQVPVGGLHIPTSLSDFDADLIYYKGRIGKLFITTLGAFGINNGKPASKNNSNPTIPPKLPDTLELAQLNIPPYPSEPKDVKITLFKNRRYTMADIGQINDKVQRLEYFTTLNFLEKQAQQSTLLDDAGLDRFKNGILVDAFTGHSVGNVLSPDYAAAINKQERYLTCLQDNANSIAVRYNSTTSTTTKTVGNKVMLPYTQVVATDLNQPYASKQIRLTEELQYIWEGDLRIVPFADNWINTTNDTTKNIVYNDNGDSDNWASLVNAWNTEIAPLTNHIVGTPATSTRAETTQLGDFRITEQVATTTTTLRGFQQLASGTQQTVPQRISGDRVVDIVASQFIRSRDFIIHATGLKNNTRVYAYFDNENVTQNCKQIRLLGATTTIESFNDLYNNNGILTGEGTSWEKIADGASAQPFYVKNNEIYIIFTVPQNKFYVGQREFKITDNEINNDGLALTFAKNTLFAQGLTQVKSDITINTRPFNASFNSATNRRTTQTSTSSSNRTLSGIVSTAEPIVPVVNNITNNFITQRIEATDQVTVNQVNDIVSRAVAGIPINAPTDLTAVNNRLTALDRSVAELQANDRTLFATDAAIVARLFPNPPVDPISQSFYVDPTNYGQGFYITAIDLYFRTKSSDNNRKVNVEIREMNNGFPSPNVIGLGDKAVLTNSQINVSSDATVATKFTFKNPIFLISGNEYCFTIKPDANDPDYAIWVAELGQIDITNPELNTRIESAYNAGVLFSSANDTTWTPRQNLDVKFKIYIAEFNTSSAIAYFENIPLTTTNYTYSAIQSAISAQSISGTSITFDLQTADAAFTNDSFTPIKNYDRLQFKSLRGISNTALETSNNFKSLRLKATLSTTNKYITPYVDAENIIFALSKNQINNELSTAVTGTVTYSAGNTIVVGTGTDFSNTVFAGEYAKFGNDYRRIAAISNNTHLTVATSFSESNAASQTITTRDEENPSGPYSSESRYITRNVTLNDGFEATDLVVYLNVNRPPGTGIHVYAKLLSEYDTDRFDEKFYTKFVLEGDEIFTLNQNEYREEKYVIPASIKTGGTELLSGTVQINSSNSVVIGTSTRFLEELKIGNTIAVGASRAERVISTISNNTFLTVESAFATNSSEQDAFKVLNNEISYVTPTQQFFSGYKYFAIKIVFTSSNEIYSPKIKDLRAIALA